MRLLVAICFFIFVAWGSVLTDIDPQDNPTGVQHVNSDDPYIFDECWEYLDCPLATIESMSPNVRLQFMKYMATYRFGPLKSNDQFHAVEGVIAFFVRKELAQRGTYFSLTNAAVLEAVERGAAIALGLSNDTGGNPASEKWVDYFTQRKLGLLTARNAHDLAWANAEQAAVDYGSRLADSCPKIPAPSTRELRWTQFTRVYRSIMQYRRTILWLIKAAFSFTSPSVSMAVEAFMDWLTDVTDEMSTGFLADLAWSVSALGLSLDGLDPVADAEILLGVATGFWEAFQQRDVLKT